MAAMCGFAGAAMFFPGSANTTCTFPPLAGSYYIAVKHRNAVQTWSATPIFIGGTPVTYNFTNQANKAFGANQKLIATSPDVYAFYSGDIDGEENINLNDMIVIESDIINYHFGYYATDINGDGNVDLLDAPIAETNLVNFIYSNHP